VCPCASAVYRLSENTPAFRLLHRILTGLANNSKSAAQNLLTFRNPEATGGGNGVVVEEVKIAVELVLDVLTCEWGRKRVKGGEEGGGEEGNVGEGEGEDQGEGEDLREVEEQRKQTSENEVVHSHGEDCRCVRQGVEEEGDTHLGGGRKGGDEVGEAGEDEDWRRIPRQLIEALRAQHLANACGDGDGDVLSPACHGGRGGLMTACFLTGVESSTEEGGENEGVGVEQRVRERAEQGKREGEGEGEGGVDGGKERIQQAEVKMEGRQILEEMEEETKMAMESDGGADVGEEKKVEDGDVKEEVHDVWSKFGVHVLTHTYIDMYTYIDVYRNICIYIYIHIYISIQKKHLIACALQCIFECMTCTALQLHIFLGV